MNHIKTSLAAAALLFGASGFLRADEPLMDWYSIGYFSPTGWYPMEYQVWGEDNDGDLLQLRVDSHFEYVNAWHTTYATGGNGYDKFLRGWGESIDGTSAAIVYLTDTVDTYEHHIELFF